MKKFSVLIILVLSMLSFRWPVNSGRITSSFGEYRPDHFHNGIDMISSDFKVYPISDGEVYYQWNRSLFPFDNYTGSGNYKLVFHGNEISMYLHLDDSDILQTKVAANDPIARFANTGRSYGNHIHFSVVNPKDWSSQNPEIFMPPVEDKTAPELAEIAFNIDGKLMIVKDKTTVRLTKNHPVLVKVLDSIQKGDRLGVYYIKVEHNDVKAVEYTFDKMSPSGKNLLIGGKRFDEIFNSSYYVVDGFKWTQGENRFKVTARDHSGNEKSFNFILNANLEF